MLKYSEVNLSLTPSWGRIGSGGGVSENALVTKEAKTKSVAHI